MKHTPQERAALLEAIRSRHSVRKYTDRPLTQEHIAALQEEIDTCNREGGLHIQLVVNERKAFGSFLAHYGFFSGVTDYIALVGPKGEGLEEKCGYYGEHLVLKAQNLGMNTCWVAATYKKVAEAFSVCEGEQLCLVIAIGYGQTQGKSRRSKNFEAVTRTQGEIPAWFRDGVEAALLAPTAVNQQKFTFELEGDRVEAAAGSGPCTRIDLGIVKYHFEVGAGQENFRWK